MQIIIDIYKLGRVFISNAMFYVKGMWFKIRQLLYRLQDHV